MLQFCLGHNLLTHVTENTDFPQQKPQDCQVQRQISIAVVCNYSVGSLLAAVSVERKSIGGVISGV